MKIIDKSEIQPEWMLLQYIAIFLPISNIFIPLLAILVVTMTLSKNGWKTINTPITRFYLCLSAWMIVMTFTAFNIPVSISGLANLLPYFLLAGINSYIIRKPKQFIHFLWLLVMSSISVSGFGILQAVLNRADWIVPQVIFSSYSIPMGFSPDYRIQSFFGHFNETAIYLLMLMPIAAHFAMGKVQSISKNKRVVAIIALVLGTLTIVLTSSRNAWLLMIVGFMGISIYYRKWKILTVIGIITGVVVWLIFGEKFGLGGGELKYLLPRVFADRLSSSVDPNFSDHASTTDRLRAWQFAISLIIQRPIQGWGLRNFPLIAQSVNYDLHGLPHEHNLFLSIAVGSGIPSLIGLIGIVTRTIWISLKSEFSRQTEGTTMIAAISIILFGLSGWLDNVYYEPRISMLLWYLIGAMYGLAKSSQKNNNHSKIYRE